MAATVATAAEEDVMGALGAAVEAVVWGPRWRQVSGDASKDLGEARAAASRRGDRKCRPRPSCLMRAEADSLPNRVRDAFLANKLAPERVDFD